MSSGAGSPRRRFRAQLRRAHARPTVWLRTPIGPAIAKATIIGECHGANARFARHGFFDLLGEDRTTEIEVVTADGASWIADVVAERCPNATLCIDAFHVVSWATDALDGVRREVWSEARRAGMRSHAKELKGCRFALWKNPEDLTTRQEAKLAFIAKANTKLYRAYLLKEQLGIAIRTKRDLGLSLLEQWRSWASRSRISAFVELSRKLGRHFAGVEAALRENVSNALIESTDTKLRVLHRMAFGFRQPEHLIALALLDRGGNCRRSPAGHNCRPAGRSAPSGLAARTHGSSRRTVIENVRPPPTSSSGRPSPR